MESLGSVAITSGLDYWNGLIVDWVIFVKPGAHRPVAGARLVS